MKSPYYLATTINAYRRAIDAVLRGSADPDLKPEDYVSELENCSHRKFTTGFMFSDGEIRQNYQTSHQVQNSEFLGVVRGDNSNYSYNQILVEMRNRFKIGDIVEVLSPTIAFGKKFKITSIQDTAGMVVEDAKKVQQLLVVTLTAVNENDTTSDVVSKIEVGDILRSTKD